MHARVPLAVPRVDVGAVRRQKLEHLQLSVDVSGPRRPAMVSGVMKRRPTCTIRTPARSAVRNQQLRNLYLVGVQGKERGERQGVCAWWERLFSSSLWTRDYMNSMQMNGLTAMEPARGDGRRTGQDEEEKQRYSKAPESRKKKVYSI